MARVRLIPYKIQQQLNDTSEIPAGIEMIQAPKKWEEGYKGRGVVVAVIDTGCDRNHPDLRNQIIDGRNFTTEKYSNPRNFSDQNGHGTHVAGTIAAALNDRGVVGVAPEAKLLILKAFDAKGSGDFHGIIQSIQHAIKWRGKNGEKVRVISMSCGAKWDVPELRQAIRKAVANDILVVCAAGNEGDGNVRTTERLYPGYYKEVVQVGAVDHEGNMAEFTNTNNEVDLVAPGVDVVSTYLNGKYAKLSGTSMATPHVSGAAAILIEQMEQELGRTLTEQELYAQLVKSTSPLQLSKRVEGNGLIMLNNEPVYKENSEHPKEEKISSKAKSDKTADIGFVIPDVEV
ncbi:S8 family peptidase [Gracilibacillus sp. YIM 98692]|uniref:S8 family peptidase n=1 Tax=Gracilibacillus sp. YIM 98692 TaxID=2663532 RepID=UPI0013D6B77F|nr:S8 family peptidase [Gracilibacillus sp. YIM 98692]